MRTRRGFARHFLLLGTTFVTGLLAGVGAVSVRTDRAPAPALRQAATVFDDRFVLIEGQQVRDVRHGLLVARTFHRGRFNSMTFRQDSHGKGGTYEFPAAWLPGAMFTECDLGGADLSRLDLRGCFFAGCNLRGADLKGANLTGVRYDSRTRWPAGFDPRTRGANPFE